MFDYEGEGSGPLSKQFPWVKHPRPPKKRKQNYDNANLVTTQPETMVEKTLKTGVKVGSVFRMKY